VVFWLRRVTAHRCIDAARRRGRRPEVPLEDVPEASEPAKLGDPLLRERLRKLVASLPEQARMIVLLRFHEDLEPAEIAELMKLRVNTVKSQLQRALAMLRDKAGKLEW
jgi:RNA polymerase sigma-70 factor (ECF subfamily)